MVIGLNKFIINTINETRYSSGNRLLNKVSNNAGKGEVQSVDVQNAIFDLDLSLTYISAIQVNINLHTSLLATDSSV